MNPMSETDIKVGVIPDYGPGYCDACGTSHDPLIIEQVTALDAEYEDKDAGKMPF